MHAYYYPRKKILSTAYCLAYAGEALTALQPFTDGDTLVVGGVAEVNHEEAFEAIKASLQYMLVDRSPTYAISLFGSVEAAQAIVDSVQLNRDIILNYALTDSVNRWNDQYRFISVEVPVDLYRTNAQAHHILQCIRPFTERRGSLVFKELVKNGIRKDIALFLSTCSEAAEYYNSSLDKTVFMYTQFDPYDQTPFNDCSRRLERVVSRLYPVVNDKWITFIESDYEYWSLIPPATVSKEDAMAFHGAMDGMSRRAPYYETIEQLETTLRGVSRSAKKVERILLKYLPKEEAYESVFSRN